MWSKKILAYFYSDVEHSREEKDFYLTLIALDVKIAKGRMNPTLTVDFSARFGRVIQLKNPPNYWGHGGLIITPPSIQKKRLFEYWRHFTMYGYVRKTEIFDGDTGEMISESTSVGSPNGRGYVLMYTEKVKDLIVRCPSASTLKVFMLLSMGQQFEERGMITTKKAIQDKLGIDKSTCLAAFKWLKDNFIVNECKVEGHTEFMVNPEFVTIGRDKKKRQIEWVRRWSNQTIATIESPKNKRSIES